MEKVAIYGTGLVGNRIYNYLSSLGINVSYFLKSFPKADELFHEIPVITAEELIDYDGNYIVIIAINNRETVSQIYELLLKTGFNEDQVVKGNIYGFISTKLAPTQNGAGYYCPCCKNDISTFLPREVTTSDLFVRYNIIGGGYREHSICTMCGAIDRHRWQAYVLANFTNILSEECNVLHIAPEEFAHKLIKSNKKCDYYAADIVLGRTDHKVDLTSIQFRENFFDYIIANHVLEHIEDIDKVFSEVKRVLNSNGKLIISFPICMDIRTKEDKLITEPEDRLREYGQSDHVRLFGYDYKEYIEKYGFRVDVKSPEDFMTDEMIEKYGLIKDDVILICSK